MSAIRIPHPSSSPVEGNRNGTSRVWYTWFRDVHDLVALLLSAGHGALTGLSDDDHTQYALLAGRAGGQTLIGGTAASQNLTLQSTSNATRGYVLSPDPLGIGIAPQTGSHVYKASGAGAATEVSRLTGSHNGTGSGPLLRFTNTHGSGTTPNAGEYNLAGIAGLDGASSWGGALAFYTSPDGTSGGANLVERMRISQSGYVGISNLTASRPVATDGSKNLVSLDAPSTTCASADVTMTNANQFYTGVSVSLGAGTWLVTGHATVSAGVGTGIDATYRIYNSTDATSYASVEDIQDATAGVAFVQSHSLSAIVTITGTKTIEIQVAGAGTGCTILKAAAHNGSGDNATAITAIRIL